jgi:hypothetical protein
MVKRLSYVVALALLFGHFGEAKAGPIIEDFEDGTLGDYTAHPAFGGGDTTAAVIAAAAHDGNFGLRLNGDNWYVSNDSVGMHLSQGDKFFAWEKLAGPGSISGREYFAFGASMTQPGYSVVLAPNTNQFLIQRNGDFSFINFADIASAAQMYLADHFYRVEVDWGVGGVITAMLFDSDGTTLLNSITATNNDVSSGTIAFRGFVDGDGGTDFDSVTLTPVPEPSTLTLLGLGIAGMAGCAWRRRKANAA